MKTSRRHFLLLSLTAGSALALSQHAFADTPNALSEADPKAQAVGYKENAVKVDKAKFPDYVAGQTCGNCSLFQGKATDAFGGCTLFGDKQVATRGWCSSYSNM
jgi:High potential iron-sulfur protein